MAPKPGFFIVRPGLEHITADGQLLSQPGSMVPLIPVDLLPACVDIVGIPRHLTPEQIIGMQNLGSFHLESEGYQLRFLQEQEEEEEELEQPDLGEQVTETSTIYASESSEPSLQQQVYVDNKPPTPTTLTSRPTPRMSQGLSSSRHNPVNNILAHPPTPPTPPTRTSKKTRSPAMPSFCRYWCLRGHCSWGRHCKYQHVMPNTIEGLNSVGLEGYPRWWRNAVADGRKEGKKRKQKSPDATMDDSPRLAVEGRPVVQAELVEDADDEREGTAGPRSVKEEENLIEL